MKDKFYWWSFLGLLGAALLFFGAYERASAAAFTQVELYENMAVLCDTQHHTPIAVAFVAKEAGLVKLSFEHACALNS